MMDWMIAPLRRYADFSGRSRRKEFWMFQLLHAIVMALLLALILASVPWGEIVTQAQIANDTGTQPPIPDFGVGFYLGYAVLIAWALATFIPMLAVTVRRLHDTDRSGWFYLLNFVPFGGIVLLVFYCIEGTRGDNRFGPDPLAGA